MKTAVAILALLLFSVPDTARAEDGYPDFSWDHVPLYAHLGIDDGLSQDQCEFLADHFSLITFTGGIVRDGISVEPKMATAAKTIKQRNPRAKVLFYWARTAISAIPGAGLVHMARSTGIRSSTNRWGGRWARAYAKVGPTRVNSHTPRCLWTWKTRPPR